jgi:hypothetical protein
MDRLFQLLKVFTFPKRLYIEFLPTGIAHFRYKEPFPPRKFIERGFNIQHWSDFPEGGHFPSIEKPQLLADYISFFSKILLPDQGDKIS